MLHGEFEPPYEVRIEVAPSMKYRNDHVLYEYVYSVEALRSAEGDDGDEDADDVDEDRIVARFQTCLVLVYSLDEATKFSDEELQAFGATTGLLTAHPFARETVASLSTRVGLPQLVLDVMRVPMPPPPDVPAEASGGDV
jgi:hypothetical protein